MANADINAKSEQIQQNAPLAIKYGSNKFGLSC